MNGVNHDILIVPCNKGSECGDYEYQKTGDFSKITQYAIVYADLDSNGQTEFNNFYKYYPDHRFTNMGISIQYTDSNSMQVDISKQITKVTALDEYKCREMQWYLTMNGNNLHYQLTDGQPN